MAGVQLQVGAGNGERHQQRVCRQTHDADVVTFDVGAAGGLEHTDGCFDDVAAVVAAAPLGGAPRCFRARPL